ncbi:hypothetical protein WKI68_07965 [Streptomyces sp. MS1.HAVA.3]|uniref:Uncharacterized protein n=1 Tax=Streptomyces caledonius TaxID=3134107 RepID=A0ABU8U173_9ACTN
MARSRSSGPSDQPSPAMWWSTTSSTCSVDGSSVVGLVGVSEKTVSLMGSSEHRSKVWEAARSRRAG